MGLNEEAGFLGGLRLETGADIGTPLMLGIRTFLHL
jgi:hypothetical protein